MKLHKGLFLLMMAVSTVACTGPAVPSPDPDGDGPFVTEGYVSSPIARPTPDGRGSLAPALPETARPTRTPAQAGPELAGQALPTNQWWSSALTGPLTQPLWAFPLAVRVAPSGIEVSAADPVATADAVTTPFNPVVTVGGAVAAVQVSGYGAFHVRLRVVQSAGGSVEVTVVQGSPLLYLRFNDTPASLRFAGRAPTDGPRLTVAGSWEALGASWTSTVDGAVAGGDQVALARVPDGVDRAQWTTATAGAATDPVVSTTAGATYEAGTVTQILTARRASGGPGVWSLLPHQRDGLVSGDALTGHYETARGQLSLVEAATVRVRLPLPGLLTTAPAVPLADGARTAVVADLAQDLVDPAPAGGSYFGLKECGRLAAIAETAAAVGAEDQRRSALDRLRAMVVDWLTYSGGTDAHYFGYDPIWGGLVAVPAEFGSNDYNDHHFQYGYLVRAAAVLAAADPTFLADYGSTVDLVVRDYTGRGPGLPPLRVFNAYLGHSAASGYAPFADGNNQESSSEAVAAWEAVVRWGLVRGDEDLVTTGLTHYAIEAASANRYWLGQGAHRPTGYGHRTVGIVWDAKLDYATWFDAKPESVLGIQLLPLTFGSLYRNDPVSAAARSSELDGQVGGPPRVWGDLFAADLALADPAAARGRLGPALPREESTSRGLVRLFVETLAALGPPQPTVVADGPGGLAFGPADAPVLVAVNPTATARTITFRRDGTVLATLTLAPGQSLTHHP